MPDIAATLAGLDALGQRVDDATHRIVEKAGFIFRDISAANAPVGDPDNSTNPPGDLASSIIAEDVTGGDGEYATRVGPTVTTAYPGPGGQIYNYGRLREFGGLIWAKSQTYMAFTSHGVYTQKLLVYQFGSFYLTRARDEGVDRVVEVMWTELTAAVRGG